MESKILIKNAVKRKKNYMYWVSREGHLMIATFMKKNRKSIKFSKKVLRDARDYFIDNSKEQTNGK